MHRFRTNTGGNQTVPGGHSVCTAAGWPADHGTDVLSDTQQVDGGRRRRDTPPPATATHCSPVFNNNWNNLVVNKIQEQHIISITVISTNYIWHSQVKRIVTTPVCVCVCASVHHHMPTLMDIPGGGIIKITLNIFVQRHWVVTSEALGQAVCY